MSTVTYSNILAPNYSVTGIRQGEGAPPFVAMLITGSYQPAGGNGQPQAMLYYGPLTPTNANDYHYLTPTFAGQTVTTSVFYGPNTWLYDPAMGQGNIRAVGSYKYSQGGAFDHGMIYQGPLDGSGTWSAIDMPSSVAGGTVANTIPHSTMGPLVVGNYDLAGDPASGNAFIYSLSTKVYTKLNLGKLATAYGIWENVVGNSNSTTTFYTICGGYDPGTGINQGLMFDYYADSGAIKNVTGFSYNNDPGIVTHFEGIMGVPGGYVMAATGDSGAAYATISRSGIDGPFGPAKWTAIANPASVGICTGNTVYKDNLLGIYQPSAGGIQSYVAKI